MIDAPPEHPPLDDQYNLSYLADTNPIPFPPIITNYDSAYLVQTDPISFLPADCPNLTSSYVAIVAAPSVHNADENIDVGMIHSPPDAPLQGATHDLNGELLYYYIYDTFVLFLISSCSYHTILPRELHTSKARIITKPVRHSIFLPHPLFILTGFRVSTY